MTTGGFRWFAFAAALAACGGSDNSPYAPAPAGSRPEGGTGGSGSSGAGGIGGVASTGGSAGASAGASAGTPDAGGVADTSVPPSGGGLTRPKRFIVLGDSIAACSNVGGKDGADCSLKKLHDYVAAKYAPDLSYENDAVAAAVAADVPGKQLATVKTGTPGHALVMIYVGGNDLAKYMFVLDGAAEQGLKADLPKVLDAWTQIFAFFADPAKFPDGATVLVSNQYNPFDNCMAAPYFITAKKNELLAQFNDAVKALATEKKALFTDQFTPFLGHGHHYQVSRCPFFMANATPFMDDVIHPNPAGHDNLFQQWKKTLDPLYGP
jgi:lysophospholipase L1-like esterase